MQHPTGGGSRYLIFVDSARRVFKHIFPFHFHLPGSRKRTELGSQRGGVLIEFAFSVPILIILLFFLLDHYRFYELREKLKASTYLAASMVQQIKNTKADKQLTSADFHHIGLASSLNFFHIHNMFSPWASGIYYIAHFHYVKKIDNDNYEYQKCFGATDRGVCEYVSQKTSSQVQEMHPDLICSNIGDERVLIECCYRMARNDFKKSMLGFFVLNPQMITGTDGMTNNFFIYKLIITPKPGLFPAKS